MTGNQIKGRGFKGALRYNLAKVEKGIAEVLDHSFTNFSEKSILKEVLLVRVQRPNLQKYFYHTSINFPPTEVLPNTLMKQIGLEYLHANGFTQHQFIMFRHHDADHPHLHILVNRIGYDGTVLSDSNDFARSEKVLRDLEKKYALTEVTSSKQAHERAMTKDELEMMKRTNTPSHKIALQILIKEVLNTNKKITCSEFIHALESKGITLLFNQATTGYVSGISYSYEGMIISGAKLGNDYKWTTLKNTINYEQERDRSAIHQANDRTRSHQPDARTGSRHPERNPIPVSQGVGENRPAHHKHKNTKHTDRTHPKTNSRRNQDGRTANSKTNRLNDLASQNSKIFNLATLLDGHRHGNLIEPVNQPDLSADNAVVRRKRKKRKRRIR